MEEFSGNLDDGELWIPSDIFPDDKLSTLSSDPLVPLNRVSNLYSFDYSPLSQALFEHRVRCTLDHPPQPHPLGFHRMGAMGPHGFDHHDPCGSRTGSVYPTHDLPVQYYCRLHKPVHPQAEGVTETRISGYLRVQQNQLGNRVLPFHESGPRIGGIGRARGGTGVFLPRTTTGGSTHGGARRRQGMRNEEIVEKRGSPASKFGVAPDVGLPHHWSY